MKHGTPTPWKILGGDNAPSHMSHVVVLKIYIIYFNIFGGHQVTSSSVFSSLNLQFTFVDFPAFLGKYLLRIFGDV